MFSLNALLSRHPRLLLLDSASERIHVGWIERDLPGRWQSCEEGAGTGLFRALEALQTNPRQAEGFVFCTGPGSILGIRTAAVAIRTWRVESPRPAFSYSSLAVAGMDAGPEGLNLITDARRGLWNVQRRGEALMRRPAVELSGPLATPEGFKSWAPLPDGVRIVPYAPHRVFEAHPDYPFFAPSDEPDAFLHEEPGYATWTPQVHKSP